jgi:hypothetical protein
MVNHKRDHSFALDPCNLPFDLVPLAYMIPRSSKTSAAIPRAVTAAGQPA